MAYVLGVDGGNTKTIALVARLDGCIVGTGRAGCGDIYGAASPETALAAVEDAVTSALGEAGVQASQLQCGVFSMAGADWPEDFDLLQTSMEWHGFGRTVVVVNDAIGALWAGSPDGTGVSVVCGTGVAVGARAADGRLWHSSFWQEPQGSQDLGHKALRAVYRAELGIDPPTTLTAAVLRTLGQPTVEDVLHLYTARSATPPDLGRLARVLLDEAAGGDATALRIVREHGRAIGDYALVAARRVGIERSPFTLVLAGGLLRHPSRLLADTLVARVQQELPMARPVMSQFEPAVGAVLLALRTAGMAVDEQVLARLVPSLPPATLFVT